jgi:predicted phage-related endonuclease
MVKRKRKEKQTMSINEIESKVKELQELRRMREELDNEMGTLEDAIKAEMTARQVEDMTAGCFRVRWTAYSSSRVDTTALKKELPDVAARYTKTTTARRFMVN